MSFQEINIGTVANDQTGDSLRTAMQKVNANFETAAVFQQGGEGAVNRTIQDKLREFVHLEDFGVVAGLEVSDTVAEANVVNAQKALDHVGLTGGKVYGVSQYYVLKSNGLRFPANVYFEGAGHGMWSPSFPSEHKTWEGTNLIFKGTGTKDVTVKGVTSMKEAGGWREDPDTPARYFKLLSLMNDDASGSTPATPRALSVAITGKDPQEPWGVSNCRIVPWIGTDGISDYSLTSGSDLGDEWDIGLLISDTEQGRFENVQIRGYWRAHGCLLLSAGHDAEGRCEGNILRKVSAQGYNGLSVRSGDIWEVQATTSNTLEIFWTDESYWPSSGAFEGLENGTDYTYSSLSRNGDNLVFNGVSPDPSGTTQICNPLRGTGFSTTFLDSCEGWALWHHSGDKAEDLGFDDPSKGGEFSGFPLRGVNGINNSWFGEDAASPCVYFHDADDLTLFGGKFEIGHVIASPVESGSSADAPAGSTLNLRLVDTYFSSSVDTRLFTPRNIYAPQLQFNPADESDGDFYFKALSGQDTQFELATGKQFQILNDDETSILRVLEATGRLGLGMTSDPARKLDVREITATTNAAFPVARWILESSGTPANGIGASHEFVVETAAGNNEIGGILEAVCTDVTSAAEHFDYVFKLMRAGAAAAEKFRFRSDGAFIPSDPRLTAQNTLSWYPVGRSTAAVDRASVNGAGDATETVAATVTIPGGALGPNGIIRVTVQWRCQGGTSNKTLRWRLGGLSGTQYYSSGTISTQLSVRDMRDIKNINSESAQAGHSVAGFGGSSSDIITSAIDTTSNVDLVFTSAWSGATSGETITLQSYLVEILYGA